MTERDLAQAIRSLPVPEHAPGFWEALDAELAGDTYARRTPAGRRRAWWSPLAAAAIVVLVAGYVLVRTSGSDESGRASTAASPAAVLPGPVQAAQQFLSDAADGDAGAVARILGPGSKAYGRETGHSVAELLTAATWPGPDSTLTAITVDPTHTVVLAGHGDAVEAVPVLHVGSGWLAEPWAYDPAVGPVGIGVGADHVPTGDPLRLTTPVEGTVQVGIDDSLGTRLTTSHREARWSPVVIGSHVVLGAQVAGDVYVADAIPVTIVGEPGSPAGAASMFRYWWLQGDRQAMARYGTAVAIDQALAVPSEAWGSAAASGCEGAAGSVYCTWTGAGGRRIVLQVDNVDRPPQVVAFRLEG